MRNAAFNKMIAAKLDRLREPLWWFPMPLFLGFGLVILLITHVTLSSNPRMGHPANILAFPAPAEPDAAIWMSVTPIGDDIVVTTADRRVFRWPQDVRTVDDVRPFVDHLKALVRTEVEGAVLLNSLTIAKTRAVIAADQQLKYLHIRPIIYALAEAGIARYGFETLSATVTAAATPAAAEEHSGEIH